MRLHSVQRLTPGFLGVLIALLAAVFFYPDSGQAAPIMTTDKADYYAAETVTVTGTGFAPNTQYDVPIIRPDGSMVKGDGTLTPGWDTVTSNGSGGFTYLYKLDGIFGSYEVRAYPVSWSGDLNEGPLTSVTFTDADIHFTQCSNDDNNDSTLDPCKWVEGALNTNNSIYTEGNAVPQRLFHKLTSVGAYQMELEYEFSKNSVYAYDFLSSPDQGPQNTLALLNPCADAPAFASACSTITNSLYTGATAVTIPSDPFDSVAGAEAAVVTREMKVACSGPGACSALAVFFPNGNGGDDLGENHDPDTDPDCVNTVAPRCGTASVKVRLSVTTPAGTSNSSPTLVAVWFAGHVSLESYWGTTCGSGGTTACGASSISGSPFHMAYSCLDEPDTPDGGCESVGQRAVQISASTVTTGDIIITKNVVTQSGTHGQDFSFTCSPTLGAFSLDDDGASSNPLSSSQAFSGIPAATYTCTESAPPSGWSLTGLTCNDSGTTVDLGTRTATIDLDNGETITCTYTNAATGTINIIKDAVPNDPQDFGFTCAAPLGSFSLDDDANPTLSNTQTFSGTLAGSYSCTESAPPAPWSLSNISCSDPDGGTTTNLGTRTATIDLDPGETISCTFTNVQGSVTIIKDAVPNDPQDFSFTGTCFGLFSLDDDADGTLSNTKSGNVGVGTCTVSEAAPPPGWTLGGIVCSDPDGGTTVNLLTWTVTFDVDAGESITCTFTNTGAGTIAIAKVCDPPTDSQSFTFTRSYGADVGIACGSTNSTSLSPGTYSVSEALPAGWDLTGAACLSSIGDTETPGAIELDAGETVTCTFTNQKDAFIKVCKETDPNGSSESFEFSSTYGSNFFVMDGLCNDSGDLSPGSYSVSEVVPAGWVLSSSPCLSSIGDTEVVGSIELDAGETVTCTFNDTKTGSITIVKDAMPNSPQGFAFSCTAPLGPFTLDDNGTNGDPFDSSKTTSGLLPGTYTCSESLPAGWSLTSLTCVDPSGGTTTTPAPVTFPGTGTATIALAAGENVTCTFENTELGSITIIKDAVPNAPQDFSFTCAAPIGGFTLDDDGAIGNPNDSSKSQGGLMPGSYLCSEAVPAGWALSTISCAGDTDSGSVVALPGVTIDLDAGEDITCTFTNTQGAITIVKDTVPNGPQDFCFNGALPDANGGNPGDFCLDDDTNVTLSNSHSVNIAPGTYTVNELGPTTGFKLTNIVCGDPDGGTTVNPVTATATIDLDAGESITCTFTNTQDGRIIIEKSCDPATDPQLFSFTPTGYGSLFSLGCGAANDSGFLTPGVYSVAESIPSGWVLTSIVCADPDGGSTGAGTTASIDLDAGETVTCLFLNTKNGNVVINKTCAGGNDTFGYAGTGSGILPLFSITCVSGSGTQSFSNVSPGPKTVTESSLPVGWALSSLACADPDNGSSTGGTTANIDLDAGETVTCTFLNSLNTATFTVFKDFSDKPGTDTTTVSVTLSCAAGTIVAPNPKPASEAAPAVFTVNGLASSTTCTATEGTPPAGYSASGCTTPVTLPAAGSASCTITNTLNSAIFTVYKDFSDKPATDTTTVSVTLTCGAGTIVAPNPKPASEAAPAVFTVNGLASSTTCTASEGAPPAGYTASGCTTPVTLPTSGSASCAITNTVIPATAASFNVAKNFVPDFPGPDPDVTINLTCTSGTVLAPDPTANEEQPDTANFTITGFTVPATCTATEPTSPAGYTKDESSCVAIAITYGGTSSCMITNTLAPTPSPTPPAVGGVVRLINDGSESPSHTTSASGAEDPSTLALLGAGMALAAVVAWVARRRLLG